MLPHARAHRDVRHQWARCRTFWQLHFPDVQGNERLLETPSLSIVKIHHWCSLVRKGWPMSIPPWSRVHLSLNNSCGSSMYTSSLFALKQLRMGPPHPFFRLWRTCLWTLNDFLKAASFSELWKHSEHSSWPWTAQVGVSSVALVHSGVSEKEVYSVQPRCEVNWDASTKWISVSLFDLR